MSNFWVERDELLVLENGESSVLGPGGGVTPYNGVYREAPPERGSFFRLQAYKRVGISKAEVHKRVVKLVI